MRGIAVGGAYTDQKRSQNALLLVSTQPQNRGEWWMRLTNENVYTNAKNSLSNMDTLIN